MPDCDTCGIEESQHHCPFCKSRICLSCLDYHVEIFHRPTVSGYMTE